MAFWVNLNLVSGPKTSTNILIDLMDLDIHNLTLQPGIKAILLFFNHTTQF